MTTVEHIHTLLPEDKDALVSSYLSLLAAIESHQDWFNDNEHFIKDIKETVHSHIEKLPEDSMPIYQELINNETKRLERIKDIEKNESKSH